MASNPKSGELPQSVDDLPASTRELIIDLYLSRGHILVRIADQVGIDADVTADQTHWTIGQLAALVRRLDADEDRPLDDIVRVETKPSLIHTVGDALGLDLDPAGGELTKSALIRILVTAATGDTPNDVDLPGEQTPTTPEP